MGVVFLLIRFTLGGYFAWHGTQHLNVYGRERLIAYARSRSVPLPLLAVPLSGLMLLVGGASLVIGVFPAAGVALLVGFLVPSAFVMHPFWRVPDAAARSEERSRFSRNLTLALATLALVFMPQPWPLTFVS
jgi:putative oxidoreductase